MQPLETEPMHKDYAPVQMVETKAFDLKFMTHQDNSHLDDLVVGDFSKALMHLSP